MTKRMILAGCCGLLMTTTAAAQQTYTPSVAPPPEAFVPHVRPLLAIERAPGPIVVDGRLDDEGWTGAAVARGFAEFQPREGEPAPIGIEAWVTYDETHLFVAFRVEDDPSQIRTSLRDRDKVWGDDVVAIILDTFGDNSWAYAIGANPSGVQLDLRLGQNGNDDASLDVLYESAGRVTETGYEVEMAIPFSSLSFPKGDVQSWRLNFIKLHPRSSMRQYAWASLSQDVPCMLCQNGRLEGLSGVRAGGRIELLPSVVASQAGGLDDGADPTSFRNSDPTAALSLGVRYPFSPGWSAEATYNPDFSQVESDAAQIDVNTTFALSYPERRPFFQEGADLFETPIAQVYTRSINSPIGAAKVIGRQGRTSVGYIGAVDERTPILVPLEERTLFVGAERSVSNIVRARHAFGESSHAGILITDRRYAAGGSGTTLGGDVRIPLGERWTLRGQLVGSHTAEPETGDLADRTLEFGDGHTVAFDGETFSGHASYLALNRSGQKWNAGATYRDASPTYRAADGFQTRNDFRSGSAYTNWSYVPGQGILDRAQVNVNGSQSWSWDGDERARSISTSSFLQLRAMTNVYFGAQHGRERFDGVVFDGLTSGWVGANTAFSEKLSFGASVNGGDGILRAFGNPRQGRFLGASASATLRPTQRLELAPSFSYQRMDDLGGAELYAGYISRGRLSYQFTRELFARVVVQYNDFNESISFEPLVMYRLNPLSVLYIGSRHGYDTFEDPYGFERTDRQFFMKLQYLFRP